MSFGGGGGCFIAGTMILIPNPNKDSSDKYIEIAIEEIKVGDIVISFDEQFVLHESKVTATFMHSGRQVMAASVWSADKPKQDVLTGTPDHFTWAQNLNAFARLEEAAVLRNWQSGLFPVTERKMLEKLTDVYNLTVEPNHTYIANGFLVHNLGGGSGGGKEQESTTSSPAWETLRPLMEQAVGKYQQLYSDYYWPIEQTLAGNDLRWTQAALGADQNVQDYLIDRSGQLVDLANDTNTTLDDSRKDLIRRLVEGEDVLADRYRSQASQDTANSFGQQRVAMQNQMSQLGINPNSGAWASSVGNLGNQEALAKAGAMTKATWDAEDKSLERMTQAQDLYTQPARLLGNQTPGLNLNTILNSAVGAAGSTTTSSMDGGGGGSGVGSIIGGGLSLAGGLLKGGK